MYKLHKIVYVTRNLNILQIYKDCSLQLSIFEMCVVKQINLRDPLEFAMPQGSTVIKFNKLYLVYCKFYDINSFNS